MDIETNINYLSDGELISEIDDKLDMLAEVYNLERISSGYGFGCRDLQYSTINAMTEEENIICHRSFVDAVYESSIGDKLSHISTNILYLNIE